MPFGKKATTKKAKKQKAKEAPSKRTKEMGGPNMGHSPAEMSPYKMGHSPAEMGHSPMKNLNKGYEQQVKSPMKMQGSWMSKHVQNLFKEMPIDNKASALEMESPANKQGYNNRLDESLGARNGKKSQSLGDRRDESKGMEESEGKGAYSSDSQMS